MFRPLHLAFTKLEALVVKLLPSLLLAYMATANARLPSRVILSGAGSREANGECVPNPEHGHCFCALIGPWKQVFLGRFHQLSPFLAAQRQRDMHLVLQKPQRAHHDVRGMVLNPQLHNRTPLPLCSHVSITQVCEQTTSNKLEQRKRGLLLCIRQRPPRQPARPPAPIRLPVDRA
jgi:hypothetical protein